MFASLSNMSLTKKIVYALIIAAVIIVGLRLKNGNADVAEDVVPADRAVTLASVGDLSLNTSPLPLLGTVTSRSEANIKAESSGKLAAVYKKLGDYVSAGEVIAEFDNGAERAGVLSAQGAYEAAKAGQGTAALSSNTAAITSGSAELSLESSKTSALNAINAAYVALDDAVRVKSDGAFRNPQTRDPQFIVNTNDSKLSIAIPQERGAIEVMLKAREAKNRTLTIDSDLITELNAVESDTLTVKDFLDDLALAYSRAIPDASVPQATVDGFKAQNGLARSGVSGTLSSIGGARSALNASIAASLVAVNNLTQTSQGSTASADANVKAALGALNAAQVRLEKTIIRSPIGGTINSLSVESGDFVPPFGDIAVVSNNGALEVIAYATEEDARVLKVGSKVTMNDTTAGVITRIASALDPKTKKIEVRIGITGDQSALINGQTVRIAAARSVAIPGKKATVLQIPLSALKITPTGAVVFTVSASSTLVAHSVKEGTLLGDQIIITEGLTPDMMIVTDARGWKDGNAVTVTK